MKPLSKVVIDRNLEWIGTIVVQKIDVDNPVSIRSLLQEYVNCSSFVSVTYASCKYYLAQYVNRKSGLTSEEREELRLDQYRFDIADQFSEIIKSNSTVLMSLLKSITFEQGGYKQHY